MTSGLEFIPQIASNSGNWTINEFHRRLIAGELKLRPAYQRNLVWNAQQRSFLIDSVLRGIPVPEIYVLNTTSAEGDEKTVVVDGQQRINACLEFLAGDLRLEGPDDLDPRWRNRIFGELDPLLQKRFRAYELVVRKLPELEDAALREIFRRLNRTNEALVAQELRHAAYVGPFIGFVERAASSPVIQELGVFTSRDYLRRRSDELMAEISLAIVSNAYPNKKEGLDELFASYERQGIPEGVLEDLTHRLGRVFRQLSPLAGSLRRSRFRNKSDFYTLCVLLAKSAEVLPLTPDNSQVLEDVLIDFGTSVDNLKRDSDEQRSAVDILEGPNGSQVASYLRAVERAASDRLSRVRRDDALQTVLGPVLATGSAKDFGPDDEAWLLPLPDETERAEDDDLDPASERKHAETVLVAASSETGLEKQAPDDKS